MDSRGLKHKRVTVFAGHYGSGKTNIAVNYALALAEHGKVNIADIDIVNPYFRTKDAAEALDKMGVRLISSSYANSNVDTPALPADIYTVFEDKSTLAVADVGGDDRGALALGRYAEMMKSENDYEMLFVFNKYRFLTSDAQGALEVMREIEAASGVEFTGIINNSNLGEETDEDAVLASVDTVNELSRISGLEIKMTTVKRELYEKLKDKIDNVQAIDLYVRQSWLRKE